MIDNFHVNADEDDDGIDVHDDADMRMMIPVLMFVLMLTCALMFMISVSIPVAILVKHHAVSIRIFSFVLNNKLERRTIIPLLANNSMCG